MHAMSEQTPADNDKCQRWRKITIDQLGYALNLTLTFAIAALGYCFALLKDKDFTPTYPANRTLEVSMVSLAACAVFGFLCAIVRLRDFRGSARRACDHPQKPTKQEMRDLDNLVWRLFYAVVVLFGIGVAALAACFVLTYGNKIM